MHLRILIYSISLLGVVNGFRYWNIYRRALKYPDLALEWADNCDKEARRMEFFDPESVVAAGMRAWAQNLRNYHKHYVQE
jgi:hypothetical protein